jgi:hypothetical protein
MSKIPSMLRTRIGFVAALAALLAGTPAARAGEGLFEGQGDVGAVLHKGAVDYDAATGAYRLTGSGENMWFAADGFYFVWKKVSGDVSITADITFPTAGGNAHKKAALLIRQSIDADSPYADAALHGNGLTSLQFRETAGGNTHEIQANVTAPRRLRLTRQGKYVYMSGAMAGDELHPAGGAMRIEIQDPFYIGIGVCAHDKDAVESAVFRDVQIETKLPPTKSYSTLETITVSSTDRRAIFIAPGRIESPRWMDDNTIEFLRDGLAWRIPADGGTPVPAKDAVGLPAAAPASSVSFANGLLQMTAPNGKITPLAHFDGGPKSLTAAPWSPDGKRIVFVSYQMLP